jgi:hypothetical protein
MAYKNSVLAKCFQKVKLKKHKKQWLKLHQFPLAMVQIATNITNKQNINSRQTVM